MNPTQTNWLPGLLMLAAGAVAALAYVFSVRRPPDGHSKQDVLDDLEARYQAKLAQLREHLAARHLQPPAQWEALRAGLEREAAEILKARDGQAHEKRKAAGRAEQKAAAQARDDGFTKRHPTLAGALLGAGVVGFFALLAVNLTQSATGRREGMPATGGTATERPAGARGPMSTPEEEDPRLVTLAQRVAAAPEDPEAVGALTMYLVRHQAFDDARPLVERLTRLDPFDLKGRVSRAVYRAVDGDAQASKDELEHLAAYYPEAYDARMFAGLIAMETEEPARALRNLEAYVASAPPQEQPPMLRRLIDQLKAPATPAQ